MRDGVTGWVPTPARVWKGWAFSDHTPTKAARSPLRTRDPPPPDMTPRRPWMPPWMAVCMSIGELVQRTTSFRDNSERTDLLCACGVAVGAHSTQAQFRRHQKSATHRERMATQLQIAARGQQQFMANPPAGLQPAWASAAASTSGHAAVAVAVAANAGARRHSSTHGSHQVSLGANLASFLTRPRACSNPRASPPPAALAVPSESDARLSCAGWRCIDITRCRAPFLNPWESSGEPWS